MTRSNLLFPQWQGAGEPGQIPEATRELRDQLPTLDFLEVPIAAPPGVHPGPAPASEQGIWHRAALLRQVRTARDLLERAAPSTVLTVGGDCSTALAPIAHLNSLYPRLAVVWFDAHGDLNTPRSSPSGHFHGMPLRHLLGEGDPDFVPANPLHPERLFLLGARDLDPAEAEVLERLPITRFSVAQLADQGRHLCAVLEQRGLTQVHLHLDLDVLEPDEFQGIGLPVPGGLSLERFAGVLTTLSSQLEGVGVSLSTYRPYRLEAVPGLRCMLETLRLGGPEG